MAALASVKGAEFEREDCERLATLANNDLWRLLDYFNQSEDGGRLDELDQTAKFLLRLLSVAQQPLRRSDMRLLALRSEQIVGSPEGFEHAVDELRQRRLVDLTPSEDGDQLVALTTVSATPVRELSEGGIANLAAARDVYEFFSAAEATGSARHSKSSLAGLLYRLAQQLDPAAVPQRAQRLVEVAMAQGSLDDAQRYIDIARSRQGLPSIHDLFVQVALYVSLQEYASAKEVLDQVAREEFDRYRVLRVLDAVALNRIRNHAESKAKIDRLLYEDSTSEEKALLVSYKIGGLLHEELWEEAQEVLNQWALRLRNAKNYPYFLRNAAAIYMLSPARNLPAAERMLDEALRIFAMEGDAFGEATTHCNYGVVHAYSGDMIAAEKHFRKSYEFLSILGTQHIREFGTNLGTALMLLGQLDRARLHMTKLLPMMETNYPSVITETNLAIIELISGDRASALTRVRSLLRTADQVRILDCWRHVRLAAVLSESSAGNAARAAALLGELEAKGGADGNVARLRTAISSGPVEPRNALALYRTDWMQYWSQNPLKMLPVATLTAKPELDHVA